MKLSLLFWSLVLSLYALGNRCDRKDWVEIAGESFESALKTWDMTPQRLESEARAKVDNALGQRSTDDRTLDWEHSEALSSWVDSRVRELARERTNSPEAEQTRKDLETAPVIFIATHPAGTMPQLTELFVRNPALRQLPHLLLVGERFQGNPRSLPKNTATEYSSAGEFSQTVQAKEIHFAGGFCDLCLKTSVAQALPQSLKFNDNVSVVVHLSAAYVGDSRIPLTQSLPQTPTSRAAKLVQYADRFLNQYSYTVSELTTNPFTRRYELADGKTVTVSFVEP